jgi:hypothetical protein
MLHSIQYGAGEVVAQDNAGNSHVCALLQSVTVDISSQTKGIKGTGLYDEIVAVMGQEVSIKAANAYCSSGLEAVATGGAITTGSRWIQTDAKTAAASVSVTPPGGGTFVRDLGVILANGQPARYNSGTVAAGEYHLTTGFTAAPYIFHASESGTLQIKYLYSLTSGETLTVLNTAVGLLVPVGVRVFNVSSDSLGVVRKIGRYFPSTALSKFSISNKVGDFASADLEFKAMATFGSTVYEAYYA